MIILSSSKKLVKRLLRRVEVLSIYGENIMSVLTQLQQQVEANTVVTESAITLLAGLKQKLDEGIAALAQNASDTSALNALSDALGAETAKLADAIVANTPATAPAPAAETPAVEGGETPA